MKFKDYLHKLYTVQNSKPCQLPLTLHWQVHVLKFNIGHIRASIPQNYPKHLYFLHSPQFQPLKNQHLLCNYEFFNMKTRHRSIF